MTPSEFDLIFDVATPDSLETWRRTARELSDAGWIVEDVDGGAAIRAGDGEPRQVRVRLSQESGPNAADVDGFAILRALGAGAIETLLSESIPRGVAVEKVIIGLNWTMVRAGDRCGVARSPDRGTEGGRTLRPEAGFAGYELSDLALYLKSTDPLARSIGLAAVNAFWNRPDADYRETKPTGGLSSLEPPGDGVIIIGGFRGALKRLPKARIVEREPIEGDIPAHLAGTAIAKARTLVVTAQTLMNGSLEPILIRAATVPRRILVGPTAPLCPPLLQHGLCEISGVVIDDPDKAERFICETGAAIMMERLAIARAVHLGVA